MQGSRAADARRIPGARRGGTMDGMRALGGHLRGALSRDWAGERVLAYGAAVSLVACAVVLLFALNRPAPFIPYHDTMEYVRSANRILDGGWWADADRLPGYPLLLAAIFLVAGRNNMVAADVVQQLFFVLATVQVYALSYRVWRNTRAATLIGLLFATNFTFLSYVRPILSDGLALCLTIALAHAIVAYIQRARVHTLWLVAALLVALIFTRAEWFLLPVPLFAYLALVAWRQGRLRALLPHAVLAVALLYATVGFYSQVNAVVNGVPGLTEVANLNLYGKVLQYGMQTGAPPQYAALERLTNGYLRSGVTDPWYIYRHEPSLGADHFAQVGAYSRAVILAHPLQFVIDSARVFVRSLYLHWPFAEVVPNAPAAGILAALEQFSATAYALFLLFPLVTLGWCVLLWRHRATAARVRIEVLCALSLLAMYDLVLTTVGSYAEYPRLHLSVAPLMLLVLVGTLLLIARRVGLPGDGSRARRQPHQARASALRVRLPQRVGVVRSARAAVGALDPRGRSAPSQAVLAAGMVGLVALLVATLALPGRAVPLAPGPQTATLAVFPGGTGATGQTSGILPRAQQTLASALAVDLTRSLVVLPLHEGSYQGQPVWYVITDVSDARIAAALGVNYAPKLANISRNCAACLQEVAAAAPLLGEGPVAFAGVPDFSPTRVVTPGEQGYPPRQAQPGAVGGQGYSPFVQLAGSGVVYNAPIVAVGAGPFDLTTHRATHDRVLAIDTQARTVALLLARGFAGGEPVLSLPMEASDARLAALERATFVPALGQAPYPNGGMRLTSDLAQNEYVPGVAISPPPVPDPLANDRPGTARAAYFSLANSEPAVGSRPGQGMRNLLRNGANSQRASLGNSALLEALRTGGDAQDVFSFFPTMRTARFAEAYSPLGDVYECVWSARAEASGLNTLQTDAVAIAEQTADRIITGPGGVPLSSAGAAINAPAVGYTAAAPALP